MNAKFPPRNGERSRREIRERRGSVTLTFTKWISSLRPAVPQKALSVLLLLYIVNDLRRGRKNKVVQLWSNPTCNKSLTLSPVRHLPGLRINSHCWQCRWLSPNDLCSRWVQELPDETSSLWPPRAPEGVMTLHTRPCSVNVNDRWII